MVPEKVPPLAYGIAEPMTSLVHWPVESSRTYKSIAAMSGWHSPTTGLAVAPAVTDVNEESMSTARSVSSSTRAERSAPLVRVW